ncbi:MAG TPA: sugar ABC transporter permease [Chloroflexota bacterium]|nr:sugar ABC transporter permease [Chloroflexota bacterium]
MVAQAQAVTASPRKRKRSSFARAETRAFYLFISPWIFGFIVFSAGPILAAAWFSLTNLTDIDINHLPKFVGLEQYKALLDDRLFWVSLKATAIYTLVSVPLNIVAALLMATLLNQKIPGLRLFRTIYYMPTVVAGVASALLWSQLLRSDTSGLINWLLSQVGLGPIDWFGSSNWAMVSLLMYNVWYFGSAMVIFLAALQGVPTALYEAAEIDGANAVRRFWNVSLPMISPVILFNAVIGLINSLQSFIPPLIITNKGGPGFATYLYGLNLFDRAFSDTQQGHGGYAAAMSWVLFLISLVLTVVFFRVSRGIVYYESGGPG